MTFLSEAMPREALTDEERKRRNREAMARWRAKNPEKMATYRAARKTAAGRRAARESRQRWRKEKPAEAKAAQARHYEKFKETHARQQWEITLADGSKQYAMGRPAAAARACVLQWCRAGEIVSVEPYNAGAMG